MKMKYSKLAFLLCFTNLVAFAQDIPYGTTMESWKITNFINSAYIDIQINRSKENYINIYLQHNNITFLSARGKYIHNSDSYNLNRIYSKNGKSYIDSNWEVRYDLKSNQLFFTNTKKNLFIFTMPAKLANESTIYKNRYMIMKLTLPDNKYIIMSIDNFLNIFE
jgi:hypothetical protein